MARPKKTEQTIANSGIKTKKRGRPPGKTMNKVESRDIKDQDTQLDSETPPYEKTVQLQSEDYDTMLLQELKSSRTEKEKAIFQKNPPSDQEQKVEIEEPEEEEDYDIEGYDIESPEEEEIEEPTDKVAKKSKQRKRGRSSENIEIEDDFYESDYFMEEEE